MRLARWRNQSQSPCLKALGGVFKKRDDKSIWIIPLIHRVLFLSLSYPSLDVTSAVLLLSLLQSLSCGKRLHNWIVVLEKRHYTYWGRTAGGRGELSHPQRPVPPTILQIKLDYMQGKGCEVTWHAMQHFSSLRHTSSRIIHNRVAADEDVSMHAVCTAPNIQFTDSSLYIYTVHDLPRALSVHDRITWLNTDSCTSLCWRKQNTLNNSCLLYSSRHGLLFEHSR